MLPEMKRIPDNDYDKRRELLADGWREIEVLETWEGRWGKHSQHDDSVRDYEEVDLYSIIDIAHRSFVHDRLHKDCHKYADMRKVVEVVRATTDLTRRIYVLRDVPVSGFLIVSDIRPQIHVDLIALRGDVRGRGYASRLIEHAASGYPAIRAGTQMTNEPAKTLYKSLGMSVVKMERTFHRP